jgi:hypothetical protein
LGVSGDLQKPDTLFNVILVSLFIPLDPGADLGLLLTPLDGYRCC